MEPSLVVKRWTRYGKDRLYVETGTGEKVGFFDLLT
ncbi:MAG: NERD domain-containing protein, partial [Pseudorhodobacter sp.]|nr:NERD domain-containing protein [Frankiaceae bacterium]